MKNFILRSKNVGVFALLVLLVLPVFPCFAQTETVKIQVNAAKSLDQVPEILSSSIWMVEVGRYPGKIVEKFFTENNPAVVMLTITHVLKSSRDFGDYKIQLAKYFESGGGYELLKGTKQTNARLIVGFDPAPMPTWLSSRSGNKKNAYRDQPFNIEELSPPNDYDKWAEVVEHTLRFLREKGLKDLGLYIGHEPNWMWLGNMDSFMKYYGYAARAAKKVDNNVMVGAAGTWSADAPKLDCDYSPFSEATRQLCLNERGWGTGSTPMIKVFIEQAAKNNIPVDFINWHTFQGNPYTFTQDAKIVREWLSDNRLKDVKLYVADWSYWKGASEYPADYLDGEETAAYAINTVFNMWKAGIDWHGYDFDVRNYGDEKKRTSERKDPVFIGDWSMLTRYGVVKPVYNAFSALSIAVGDKEKRKMLLPETKISGSDVSVIATMSPNKDKAYVLLSNFVPSFPQPRLMILRKMMESRIPAVTQDIMKAFSEVRKEFARQRKKPSREELIATIKKEVISELNLKERDPAKKLILGDLGKSAECLNAMIKGANEAFVRCSENLQSSLRTNEVKGLLTDLTDKLKLLKVNIEFQNLPISGKAMVTTYTIDRDHSNPCSINKRTEPEKTGALCGIGGSIDAAVLKAKRKSEKDLFAAVEEVDKMAEVSLEGSKKTREVNAAENKLTIDIGMEPNSVWLIELSGK